MENSNETKPQRAPNALMKYFAYNHLPEHLQTVSKPFYELANKIDTELPINSESTTALRKLIEAKDAAVRAALP